MGPTAWAPTYQGQSSYSCNRGQCRVPGTAPSLRKTSWIPVGKWITWGPFPSPSDSPQSTRSTAQGPTDYHTGLGDPRPHSRGSPCSWNPWSCHMYCAIQKFWPNRLLTWLVRGTAKSLTGTEVTVCDPSPTTLRDVKHTWIQRCFFDASSARMIICASCIIKIHGPRSPGVEAGVSWLPSLLLTHRGRVCFLSPQLWVCHQTGPG